MFFVCACVLRDKHLFVVLHDGEDGVDGAEDSQGHDRLVLILFVLFTLKHSSEDFSLKKKTTHTRTVFTSLLLYYICSNIYKYICALCSYQVLSHVHGDGRHLLVVLADHLLNDVGQVVVLRLLDHVKQLLHDGPHIRPDVKLGCVGTRRQSTNVRGLLIEPSV